jgi:C-terminal processing protease CtpA/Prc
VVDVVDERGLAIDDAFVIPVDCPSVQRWGRAGGVLHVPVGFCTIRAWRRDGVFHTLGQPETFEVGPDDPTYALLELPSARKGGIGVRFMPEADGMRVMEVVPGSAAADAGLEAGDLVLDVAGQPTAGMETATFVELMTGAEGTDVTFTVGWSGDTGLVEETLTVARRFLDG